MEYFSIIKDSDIFEDPTAEPKEYITRLTVKGLVFDSDNKIALLCNPIGYGLLPGGGVEKEENLESAFMRECREELGCQIEITSKIGVAIQLRDRQGQKYEIHFYVSKILGEKGTPTTQQEDELQATIKWLTLEELHQQLEYQVSTIKKDYYQTQFNSRTHLAALKLYLSTIEGVRQERIQPSR